MAMTLEQFMAMTPEEIKAMTPKKIKELTPEQKDVMSSLIDLDELTTDQLDALTGGPPKLTRSTPIQMMGVPPSFGPPPKLTRSTNAPENWPVQMMGVPPSFGPPPKLTRSTNAHEDWPVQMMGPPPKLTRSTNAPENWSVETTEDQFFADADAALALDSVFSDFSDFMKGYTVIDGKIVPV
jgi:hypothetical protein